MTDPADAARPGPVDPDGPRPGDGSPSDLSATLSRLSEPDVQPAERRRLLVRIAGGTGRGATAAFRGPRAAVRWAVDTLVDVVPHLTVRDLDTLRRHHDGKDGDALAAALVRNASRVTAAIGAGGGGVAAVEWVAPPTLLTAPVLIAAETVAVVAVEVKLLAELHEVYGSPVTGTSSERAGKLLSSWAGRRGVSLLHTGRGMATVLGTGARKELRERIVRRMGRNLTTLGPLLTGAAVGAELNRRATKSLGEQVTEDLRKMAIRGEIVRPAPLRAIPGGRPDGPPPMS